MVQIKRAVIDRSDADDYLLNQLYDGDESIVRFHIYLTDDEQVAVCEHINGTFSVIYGNQNIFGATLQECEALFLDWITCDHQRLS